MAPTPPPQRGAARNLALRGRYNIRGVAGYDLPAPMANGTHAASV